MPDNVTVTMSVSEVADQRGAGAPREARRAAMRLVEALGRGDLDAADAIARQLPDPPPPGVVEPLGMLHAARGRFSEASALLQRVRRPEPHVQALSRYAMNMTAMQTHRPGVYRVLVDAPVQHAYEIDQVNGMPTIVRPRPTTGSTSGGTSGSTSGGASGGASQGSAVVPGGDPRKALEATWAQQTKLGPAGSAMTLLGVGDGHLLKKLADEPPRTLLGNEQAVVIIEPDVDLLRACLMLHDLTGPIEQARFTWCVGDAWLTVLREELQAQPQLPLPRDVVTLSTEAARGPVGRQYTQLAKELDEVDARLADAISRYYAGRSAQDFARAIAGRAGRPPRALLLTSRFTTVLQYSTRDTAEALERLGWQTRTVIEDAPHHQLTVRHVRQLLHDLQPDLVFMIDHLRRESGDLFPPQLPFVCWIQDNLPNLTSEAAGASVGYRDFVLTCAGATYAGRYGYPMRQCLYLDKLTRRVQRPTPWRAGKEDGDDLAFVSHASGEPTQIAQKLVSLTAGNPDLQRLVRACTDEILSIYQRGDHIHSHSQMQELVEGASRSLEMPPLPEVQREQWVTELFNRLNNTLYRQQALEWIADAADQRGLTLALYGDGWERHPRFARYARGKVAYGEPLENMTRRTRINLQIVPFGVLHQRLLDGLSAGGFFLIREHPVDALTPKLTRLPRDLPEQVRHADDARRVLQGGDRQAFDELVRQYDLLFSPAGADIVELSRLLMDQGAEHRLLALPRRDEVTFRDAQGFEALLDRYLHDPQARQEVWREQFEYVQRYLTYAGDLPRLLNLVCRRLETEPAAEGNVRDRAP